MSFMSANKKNLISAMNQVYSLLNRNKIFRISKEELNDKIATLLVLGLKGTDLLKEFYQANPDHKAVFQINKIIRNCSESKIYQGAKEIILAADQSRNYPSLADWFFERKFLESKEVPSKNYTYVKLE